MRPGNRRSAAASAPILRSYADYYGRVRTHRSLEKDRPVCRLVQRTGVVYSLAILGGLHHHYARV
jgi:hypothetical protein